MNLFVGIGRLTKDPDVRYRQSNGKDLCIAGYTLAIGYYQNGKEDTDYINCIAFGKLGEFAEKYLRKGTKIAVRGRVKTGSYTNKEGRKVYTTNVYVDQQEFAESKGGGRQQAGSSQPDSQAQDDGFMSIPDGMDEELPFT